MARGFEVDFKYLLLVSGRRLLYYDVGGQYSSTGMLLRVYSTQQDLQWCDRERVAEGAVAELLQSMLLADGQRLRLCDASILLHILVEATWSVGRGRMRGAALLRACGFE